MKVIIIEDEKPAYEKLVCFLSRYDPQAEIIGYGQSVAESVKLLKEKGSLADLLLVDVQLSDGLSFMALDQVPIKKPVIFITAYNQYALEAFKANGIDYLLKPVTFEAFSASIEKLKQLSGNFPDQPSSFRQLYQQMDRPQYKERFLVKIGDHIHAVTTDQIALFYAEGRNTYLLKNDGRHLITDYKLETLEEMLSPEQFFRVNRSYIVSLSGIKDVLVYSNSRLKINTSVHYKEEIIVSRDKVNAFKEWYGGGVR